MPNWCRNDLVVRGKPEDLREFKHRVRSEERNPENGQRWPIGFERHVPEPADLSHDEGPTSDGDLPDWYWWRREHWGTKWNAMYPSRPRGSLKSGELIYRFYTANAPPEPWMHVVAAEHPRLRFELRYEVEYWGGGEIKWRWGRLTGATVTVG